MAWALPWLRYISPLAQVSTDWFAKIIFLEFSNNIYQNDFSHPGLLDVWEGNERTRSWKTGILQPSPFSNLSLPALASVFRFGLYIWLISMPVGLDRGNWLMKSDMVTHGRLERHWFVKKGSRQGISQTTCEQVFRSPITLFFLWVAQRMHCFWSIALLSHSSQWWLTNSISSSSFSLLSSIYYGPFHWIITTPVHPLCRGPPNCWNNPPPHPLGVSLRVSSAGFDRFGSYARLFLMLQASYAFAESALVVTMSV